MELAAIGLRALGWPWVAACQEREDAAVAPRVPFALDIAPPSSGKPLSHTYFCRDWPAIHDSIATIKCQFGYTWSG
jgi:hypothetical protein